MLFSNLNWIAVVLSAVASMVVGFVWYSPPLFQKAYLAEIGKTAEEAAATPPTNYLISLVLAIIEAIFLSGLVGAMGSAGVGSGLVAGFLVWVGFVATTSAANTLFGDRTFRLWYVQNGNHLLTLLAMGVIIGLMG
jgi:F0F1-type ATP synthase membrane subunit c/vacuolar-type H+-ATPase subunit K